MNHSEALTLLEKIDYSKNPLEVRKEIEDIINNCPLCLEAHYLLSRLEQNVETKEKILLNALNLGRKALNDNPDTPGLKTLITRGVIEIGILYQEFGKYKMAIKEFESIMDEEDEHLTRYHLMSLYSLIEDNKCKDLYNKYKDKDSNNIRLRLPYLIYLYKTNDINEFKKIFDEINSNNKFIFKVLKGEIKEEENIQDPILDEALKVLRNNAFLINSCPAVITYISSMI